MYYCVVCGVCVPRGGFVVWLSGTALLIYLHLSSSSSFHLPQNPTQNPGGGGGHHGPPLQPFKRTAMPEGPLFEEHELIWDDRVAAEMCLDFDASFVPTGEVRLVSCHPPTHLPTY